MHSYQIQHKLYFELIHVQTDDKAGCDYYVTIINYGVCPSNLDFFPWPLGGNICSCKTTSGPIQVDIFHTWLIGYGLVIDDWMRFHSSSHHIQFQDTMIGTKVNLKAPKHDFTNKWVTSLFLCLSFSIDGCSTGLAYLLSGKLLFNVECSSVIMAGFNDLRWWHHSTEGFRLDNQQATGSLAT